MKLKRKINQNTEISAGAMSDLAFLLIIFFIMFAVFEVSRGFLIQLPKKHSKKTVRTDEIVKIILNKKGEMRVDNKQIDLLSLKDIILRKKKQEKDLIVYILVHSQCQYQNLIDLINLTRETEVFNLSFKMLDEKQGDGT